MDKAKQCEESLTLEIIRDSDALIEFINAHPDQAVAASLLKWSPENFEWLFESNAHSDPCGLCVRHRTFDSEGKCHCNDCPICPCDHEAFRKMSDAQASGNFELHVQAAKEYSDFLKEKLSRKE